MTVRPLIDVVDVLPLSDNTLVILFADDALKRFDVSPFLRRDGTVFEALRDPATFAAAYVALGTVAWPGNVDLDPELLYEKGSDIESMEGTKLTEEEGARLLRMLLRSPSRKGLEALIFYFESRQSPGSPADEPNRQTLEELRQAAQNAQAQVVEGAPGARLGDEWIRAHVVPVCEALRTNPSLAVSSTEVRALLDADFERALANSQPSAKAYEQPVELVNISPKGLLLTVAGEQLHLSHDDFPFFTKATLEQICQVTQPRPGWLHWASLDVDISVESIRAPEKFPLCSQVAAQGQPPPASPELLLLDTVALLAGDGDLVSQGAVGVVVELLDGTMVLVEFAGLDGAAYATTVVDRAHLLRLHHGDPEAPSAGEREHKERLAEAKFQAKRESVISTLANAFQQSLTVALPGQIRTPADQVLHPSMLVLRDSVPVVAVEVDDMDCSDFESVDLLEGCKSVDSLLYILLVGVRPRRALLFSRTSSGWGCTKLIGPAASIELPALDFQMALADVYARPAAATGCLEADPDTWLHTPEMEAARARNVWWSEGLNISYYELFKLARQAGRDAALEHARAGRSIAYQAANGELKHYDVDNPFPLLLEKLRADPVYAVGMFEEFWQLHLANDPSSRPLRQYFLKVLRLSKPDLSAVITDEVAGEGWKRSQLARMIMDPGKAKQMSLRRLVGKSAAPQQTGDD